MSLWDVANQQLKGLVAYEPGKPIEEVARDLGLDPDKIVKVASNENPLGPSPKAVEAMTKELQNAHIYPDGGGYRLREAIAGKFGVGMENVILGNGSNEIIEFVGHAFLKPGSEIIVADHAFVVYKLMATLFGATTVEVADPNFLHDLDAMADAITENTRQIFIANPNNPTGTLVGQEEIDRFMDRVPDSVVVIFDEAYYEFLEEPPDTLKFIKERPNVIVLRTFSKIQGLAGLRIGYGIGSSELVGILQKTRQPFNANSIAQAGAIAGLLDDEHQQRTREVNREGRDYLEKTFGEMGLNYVPSSANFVLVEVGDGNALFAAMMKEGVIIRAMAGYKLPGWVRISVGTMEENRRTIDVMKDCLAKLQSEGN